eukprot:5199305-Pyramimonas_sp.AAC.1
MATWGPLPGDRQTVVRGELLAMLLALQVSDHDVVYIADCEGAYLNFYRGHLNSPAGPDVDLWHQVGVEQARRSGDYVVLFTNSHATGED